MSENAMCHQDVLVYSVLKHIDTLATVEMPPQDPWHILQRPNHQVTEMNMCRWSCGHTIISDHVRN